MDLTKELRKTVKTTRTRKYDLLSSRSIDNKFTNAKLITLVYKNYGLKYLYQHYGVRHLNVRFPSGISRTYLINNMVRFARIWASYHGHNLFKEEHNIQSINKMLNELCVNFIGYRKKQYKLRHYWSKRGIKHYLRTHRCTLSGYGRISFKHSLDDIKSFTFKQNGHRIYLVNNYTLKMPYFGKIMTSQSLTFLKHKRIAEVRIIEKTPHVYQLQVVVLVKYRRHLTESQLNNVQGLDVNSKDDKFFCFSDGSKPVSWSRHVKNKFLHYDIQTRELQHYLTTKNHRFDGSCKTKHVKNMLRKIRAKAAYMIDQWQIGEIHIFIRKYPVLAMEDLKSFTMRLNKRYKKNLRKNTNHKLAIIQPTRFKKMMEDLYQDAHCLLLVVNPFDTSKCCHYCNYINKDLKFQKKWKCQNPKCNRWILRDPNATLNIRDWAVHPRKHALWRLKGKYPKKYAWVKLNDLVTVF